MPHIGVAAQAGGEAREIASPIRYNSLPVRNDSPSRNPSSLIRLRKRRRLPVSTVSP
jgi:hypothetical protein